LGEYEKEIQSEIFYEGSIGISFRRHYFNTCPITAFDVWGPEPLLFIDGHEIPLKTAYDLLMVYYGDDNNGNYCEMADGPVIHIWSPKLSIGPHNVTVEITSNRGKLYQFSWCFTIVEDKGN
jgi:hypothetical protein